MLKLKDLVVLLCLITFFTSATFSASVSGVVYDEGLNPVKGAVVRLEKEGTLYSQAVTDAAGAYSLSFPEGGYRLITTAVLDNQTLQTSAILNLSENDTIHVDILLMPELGIEIPELVIVEEEAPFPTPVEEPTIDWAAIGFTATLFIAALLVIYFIWKRKTEEIRKEFEALKLKTEEERPLGKFLTDDERVYQLIRRRGEVPQKHLVTETGFSKAKMTLILEKLEKLGRITRRSVGREKIIKLVE